MKRTHRKIAGAAGLALCLGIGLGYWAMTEPAAEVTRHASAGLAPASAPGPFTPAASAPAAIPPASGASAPAADDLFAKLSPRARRMAADWCGYGAAEMMKDALAREAAGKDGHTPSDGEPPSDGEQVMDTMRAQRLQDWIRTLRGRSDLRSQAIGDYLAGDTPSRAHLQELARRSTDPMVTALALARPCKAEGCRMVDAAQWARLEPDNLMAWMAQLTDRPPTPEQLSYLIERMGRDATRADDYSLALSQAVASLAQARAPGLLQSAETELLSQQIMHMPLLSLRPVLEACKPGRTPTAPAGACMHIAELMWSMPHLMHRALALALARRALPAGDAQRAEWARRGERYEVLAEALMDANATAFEQLLDPSKPDLCGVSGRMHEMLRQVMGTGEWERAAQAWAAASQPQEALIQRAREKRGGRSMMEEMPALDRPASGAGR